MTANPPRPKPAHVALPKHLSAALFLEQVESLIVQRLQNESATPMGRATLLRETGIDDPLLLEEMTRLGVTAEGLLALRLFPLVLVAWAEQRVDAAEHRAVMDEAAKLGIREDSVAGVLLDHWLTYEPPGASVDAWRRYMHGIFQQMTPVAQQKMIRKTEQQMLAVAKAAGGILGIGSVSKREQTMIDKLVRELREQTR